VVTSQEWWLCTGLKTVKIIKKGMNVKSFKKRKRKNAKEQWKNFKKNLSFLFFKSVKAFQ